MELITIENQEIRLSSFMDELAFGKTNYDSIVKQEGVLAECDISENEKYHFTFSPWSFSEVKSYNDVERNTPVVFYCGTNPLSPEAKTLLQYYDEADKENAGEKEKDLVFKASYIICSIYTQAAVEGVTLPINGAAGILMDLTGEKPRILFLPSNLFKYSAGGLDSARYSRSHGSWVNPTLFDLPSLCFARAVIAYKMLTGRFPYAATDSTERNADILDRKFLPLELCVNGVNPILATEVNKALKLNSNEVAVPGKKKKGKASEDLTPTATFPLEILYQQKNNKNTTKLSDEALAEKAKSYWKALDTKINAKRKIRRNITSIIVGAIVAVILLIIGINTVKSSRDNFTSLGLTSTETIQAYYYGMNTLDSALMENISKGKVPGRFINTVSQVYVISKSRQAYAHDMGYINPAYWFLFATDMKKNTKAGIYGATNLKIDGKAVEIDPLLHKKGEKIAPVLEENGITLTKKMKSVHNVEYFFIHSEGETNDITVEKGFETFTLEYINNRWIITNIEQDLIETNFNSLTFKNEYFYTLKQNDDDVYKTVQQMKAKYPWLPSKYALEKEQIRIIKEQEDLFPLLNPNNQK